jgi:cyclopropane fatty-acyl-phospholipid synthase-like methyltransferase
LGGLTSALLAAGHRVGAVDLSQKSVTYVADRFAGQTNFLGARIVADVAGAPFPLADVVFSVETIEHVTDRHVDDYFSIIARLLKPGGLAIFTTPNDENIESAAVFCPESGAVFHPMQHVRSFDPGRIDQFVSAHGFEPLTTFVTDFGLSLRERPKAWFADKGKRLLGMGVPPPHLVAVTRKKS